MTVVTSLTLLQGSRFDMDSSEQPVHVMLVVSRYDIFILGRALEVMRRGGRLGGPDSSVADTVAAARESIDNYAGGMSTTLSHTAQSSTCSQISYLQLSCSQHLYFATSSLWTTGGLLAGEYPTFIVMYYSMVTTLSFLFCDLSCTITHL